MDRYVRLAMVLLIAAVVFAIVGIPWGLWICVILVLGCIYLSLYQGQHRIR